MASDSGAGTPATAGAAAPAVSGAPSSRTQLSMWPLIRPYWVSEDRFKAWTLFLAITALTLATVPKLAVVVRKSYGQAYLNLGGGVADVLAVMTTGEVGFVDPAVAVSVVHNRRPDAADADYAALVRDMVVSNSPYELAGMFAAHAVIAPSQTRDWLIRMREVYQRRAEGGIGRHRLATWPTSL